MSNYKATAAQFVFCFPHVPMFWPGALCSHSVKSPSWPPPSLSSLPRQNPFKFWTRNLQYFAAASQFVLAGYLKKLPVNFFSTHVISRSQSEPRISPGNFAVKFVIFPVIGYSMFQHLTCLPYYSLQHVQHLFLHPDLVFLKVWKFVFFLGIFLTSNHVNVHA